MGISFNAASLLNGNGIDVSSVVSKIQTAQSGQLTAWQNDLSTLQTQGTSITNINNDLSTLASAIQALSDPVGALTQLSATSSESAIVSASTQNGAVAGNYNVVVSSLASTGTLYTDAVANANTSILAAGQSSGDLQVQIGGTSGTTADFAITSSNDTLSSLAASINAKSSADNLGITANVVTDASGARLAIYSQASGTPGALAVAANTTSLTFEPPVGGTNANLTINGIPYASSTNAITGAIPDVTFNLTSADPATPVQISVGPNASAITNAINNFVTAYNTVVTDINSEFAVNTSTNQQGPLGSDNSLRILQSSLFTDASYATTDPTSVSSGYNSLASLGITTNNDGTLSFDTSTFGNALGSNPAAVLNFFQNSNAKGFANNFTTSLNSLTDPSSGVLNEDLSANQNQQTDLNTEITHFQTELAAQQQQLDQVFNQVNATLEEYPFTLQEVEAALGSLSSSGSPTTPAVNTNTAPATGTSLAG
jgi:flagellar hook-associated protein 2